MLYLDSSALVKLDALHLAAALRLGRSPEAVVTYDRRMTDAASVLGLPLIAPR